MGVVCSDDTDDSSSRAHPKRAQCRQEHPDTYDYNRRSPIHWLPVRHCRLRSNSAFSQDCGWNNSNRYNQAKWNKDQIIHVTQNGHEIRDQINWTEHIRDDSRYEGLCVPRGIGMARSQIQSERLLIEMVRALFEFLQD